MKNAIKLIKVGNLRFWTALQLYEMAIDIVPNKYEMHTILRYLAPISITSGLDENTLIICGAKI